MNLKKIMIGDHCIVTSSKRFHLSERVEVGIPFYRSKEIIQKFNGEVVSECDYIPIEEYVNIKKQFGAPRVGDLLLTTRGTYGVPYVYKEKDCFYFADGNITWFKDFDEQLNSKYLYYWFQSYEGYQKVDAIAKGTAQKAVPITTLKQLELYTPIIDLQNKIVDILSAYDDLIENNQKQIKLLEEAAQRLYKEWFVDLRFPGHENVEIVEGIPIGWNKCFIDDIFQIRYGKTLPTSKISNEGAYPVYGANGIIGYYNEKNCDDYTVLITCRGNGSGDVSRTHDKESFVTNNSFIVKPLNSLYRVSYVYQLMKHTDFKRVCTGSAQPQLTNTSISTIIVTKPAEEVIELFCDRTDNLYKKIESLLRQNLFLEEARNRLLPKLMSGEIEV